MSLAAPGGRLTSDAAAMVGARLASALATLVATPFLYARLGPDAYGLWVLVLGAYAVIGLGDLGLGSAQLREVARARACERPAQAGPALALGASVLPLLGVAATAAVLLSWPALENLLSLGELSGATRSCALLLGAALVVEGAASPWRAVLEGVGHIPAAAAVTAGTGVLAAVLGVIFVATGRGVVGLALGWLLATVVRAGLLLWLARSREPVFRPSFRGLGASEVGRLLGYGGRVQASYAAAVVNNEADRLLIGGAFSTAAAASFDIGSRLGSLLRLLPWGVLYAFFPAAAGLDARNDRAALDAVYLRTTHALATFACLGGAALVAAADPLVRLWLGAPLPLAATSLALLAAGYAVNLIGGAATAVARAEGRPGHETRAMLLTAALNIALSVPLLVALGAPGVPAGTALATVLGTLYFLHLFHRESGRPLRPLVEAVWAPLVAGATAAATTAALGPVLTAGGGRVGAAAEVLERGALCLALAGALLLVFRALGARVGRRLALRLAPRPLQRPGGVR